MHDEDILHVFFLLFIYQTPYLYFRWVFSILHNGSEYLTSVTFQVVLLIWSNFNFSMEK